MKKKIITATAAFLFALTTTFASDIKPVPTAIANELQQEFKNASNIAWKTTTAFYKASFMVENRAMEAFFSYDGQLIGVSRKINVDQLPLSLIKDVNEKEATNTISYLFELLTDRGTEYFITYGTGKDHKTYKSAGTSWSRYKEAAFFQSN